MCSATKTEEKPCQTQEPKGLKSPVCCRLTNMQGLATARAWLCNTESSVGNAGQPADNTDMQSPMAGHCNRSPIDMMVHVLEKHWDKPMSTAKLQPVGTHKGLDVGCCGGEERGTSAVEAS